MSRMMCNVNLIENITELRYRRKSNNNGENIYLLIKKKKQAKRKEMKKINR